MLKILVYLVFFPIDSSSPFPIITACCVGDFYADLMLPIVISPFSPKGFCYWLELEVPWPTPPELPDCKSLMLSPCLQITGDVNFFIINGAPNSPRSFRLPTKGGGILCSPC